MSKRFKVSEHGLHKEIKEFHENLIDTNGGIITVIFSEHALLQAENRKIKLPLSCHKKNGGVSVLTEPFEEKNSVIRVRRIKSKIPLTKEHEELLEAYDNWVSSDTEAYTRKYDGSANKHEYNELTPDIWEDAFNLTIEMDDDYDDEDNYFRRKIRARSDDYNEDGSEYIGDRYRRIDEQIWENEETDLASHLIQESAHYEFLRESKKQGYMNLYNMFEHEIDTFNVKNIEPVNFTTNNGEVDGELTDIGYLIRVGGEFYEIAISMKKCEEVDPIDASHYYAYREAINTGEHSLDHYDVWGNDKIGSSINLQQKRIYQSAIERLARKYKCEIKDLEKLFYGCHMGLFHCNTCVAKYPLCKVRKVVAPHLSEEKILSISY